MTAVLPRLPVATDPGLRRRHLLALPDGVAPDEVEVLAMSRFLRAHWEDQAEPSTQTRGILRPVTAAFGIRAVGSEAPVRMLRVSRHTTLAGPYRVERDDVVELGLPAATTRVFDVTCPRERGEKPYPGGDRDGLKRAFPTGMPIREEERVLLWLVACARRLGGAVRTGDRGVVLTPDIESAIDLTVYTDTWVEPEGALALVQRAVPRARISESTSSWNGPIPGVSRLPDDGRVFEPGLTGLRAALEVHGVVDEGERRRLAAEASAFDELMLAAPPPDESFGVLVDLGVDGMISVEVGAETEVPPLLRDLPWTAGGVVAYRVHWEPFLVEELEAEHPGLEHRVARGRAAPQVQAIARALQAAVGGEIADEADFLVDPADL